MTCFLITDYDFHDVDLETGLLREAGMEVKTAQCRTEEDVIAAAKGCDGVLIQYAPLNEKVFKARPEVRIVSRLGAGYDTVNVADARKHGVWVANSPDYGVGEVASHALGMALALVRHLPFYDRDIRGAKWHYTSAGKLRRPKELTLGLLGLGRIGKRMAAISHEAFRDVIACDPYIADTEFPPYVRRVDRDALFREADLVSLHVPLNEETRGIVNTAALALMKPGSWVVNTARGGLVDIPALLAALDANRLDGAALDVLPTEPPASSDPLVTHSRVLLTPHAAFYSAEAEQELRRKAAQNLVDWARTGRPRYVVSEGRA
ncbi:C-terminal binding protein [Usitatibacter palustris]|uniref:Glyoxylate/hydroxypyruvate reductase B n=1 Tax=Usitatibacter palustris TaxID=2732487 RepID=A0A6M4H598_9PROT|nr:C-terminal binding protein [Usitatibacter palustris]QJR14786.1 Glyoxylate/hydroxypyruvate reductase B [Usitatibacter palustris]